MFCILFDYLLLCSLKEKKIYFHVALNDFIALILKECISDFLIAIVKAKETLTTEIQDLKMRLLFLILI